MAEGLVGGGGFAADASLIKADANRQRGVEGSQGLAPDRQAEVTAAKTMIVRAEERLALYP